MCLLLAACSKSGSGGTGMGSADDGMGEGNIPLAQPGQELADVNFAFDSSELNGGAQSTLRDNGQWLMDNPGKRVVIEGHCDERGTNEYNMALGERRARSVYQFLRSLGVQSEQLSTISYGEELPLDPRSNEAAWAKNRRAHFAIR
ncbi:MAG: peptidoglycan-associated lipoprotein Pal [Bdellovibrionales bacterium]|nr:peptidoglycan-associated lipoprotein Pal [Bdellovibrionales bacterium]